MSATVEARAVVRGGRLCARQGVEALPRGAWRSLCPRARGVKAVAHRPQGHTDVLEGRRKASVNGARLPWKAERNFHESGVVSLRVFAWLPLLTACLFLHSHRLAR